MTDKHLNFALWAIALTAVGLGLFLGYVFSTPSNAQTAAVVVIALGWVYCLLPAPRQVINDVRASGLPTVSVWDFLTPLVLLAVLVAVGLHPVSALLAMLAGRTISRVALIIAAQITGWRPPPA